MCWCDAAKDNNQASKEHPSKRTHIYIYSAAVHIVDTTTNLRFTWTKLEARNEEVDCAGKGMHHEPHLTNYLMCRKKRMWDKEYEEAIKFTASDSTNRHDNELEGEKKAKF